MKITILLGALATIAVAVPTNHHEYLQEQESAWESLPSTIQREKKSPLDDHHAVRLTEDGPAQIITKSGLKSMEGRSLGSKKPIIVKKKIGYHVYRDSDEEMAHADPNENCRKEIKVKLCDDEPGSPKNTVSCIALNDALNEGVSDKEIEKSIKTAKEAVENLQRGLHKTEHNSEKLANVEDKVLEDDLAVHQHIEAARKALEHVQQNFGNLDAQAPKTEEFQPKSSDEERLAQWKEAIDNIHKNFEIARNIEDAFKADSDQTNLQSTHKDDSFKIRESEHTESNVDSQQESNTASLGKVEKLTDESDTVKKQRENSDIDMFTAPTEHKELNTKLHSDSLRTVEKLTEEPLTETETKTKNSDQSNEHVSLMKSSEFTPKADEPSKTEVTKFENHQEVSDHSHQQQSKTVNNFNLENEKFMTLTTEKNILSEIEDITPSVQVKSVDTLAKSAHKESFEQTIKHSEHDMSMESSDISTHQHHLEMKNSLNHEISKSTHKGDTIVAKTPLTDGQAFDQSLNAKSVHVDQHQNHIERMRHVIPEHQQENETNKPHHRNNMHFNDEKHKEFNHAKVLKNERQNIDAHTVMRMIEDQNMEHKENEMHELHKLNVHSGMRMTEDENKFNSFLTNRAHEHQQKDLISPKTGEFNKQNHFHNEHTSMRIGQDDSSDHQLSESHEQTHLTTQGALDNHQPLITMSAAEFLEAVRMNRDPEIQKKLLANQDFRDLFLMQMDEANQHNDKPKTTPKLKKGHLHKASAENRFAHNHLANTHDLSHLGPRTDEHLHIMKHTIPSEMDSAMQPSTHVSMRDAIGKPAFERNDMHWNHHHHAMARYGSGLPITSASPGAVGVFPNANTGSCGIPLMLSCSPSVVSGTLAKAQPHPGPISAPAYRSGNDVMYYMKRDAKDTDELPTIKIQKSSIPFNHKPMLTFDKTQ